MKEELKKIISEAISNLYSLNFENVKIEIPKEKENGDFSTNVAFLLSKTVLSTPDKVASEIGFYLSEKRDTFKEVKIVKGFINLFMSDTFYLNKLISFLEKKDTYLKENVEDPVKHYINIEFISANPTGPMHVGHGRSAVIGDVLANIFEFYGHKVLREYYINDAGNQVKLFALSVLARMKELKGLEYNFPEDGYKGTYVYEIAQKILENYGYTEDISKIEEISLEYIMNNIKETIELLGVKIEKYTSEKEINKTIPEVLKLLESKGLIKEEDGALWFKSSEIEDDKDRVLRKKDGAYTYFANDIAYHLDKHKRGFDKAINVWGADHHGYIKRLISALKAIGIKESWLEIILFQIVRLFKDGKELKMSKRTGDILELRDLIEEVGKDSTRFIFLTKKAQTPLDFDIDLVKTENSENPVFYVQYAYARAFNILQEAKKQNIEVDNISIEKEVELNEEELELLKNILSTKDYIYEAYQKRDPNLLVACAINIASSFHKFYNKHKVITSTEKIRNIRLNIVKAVKESLLILFNLMGVEAPRRM